MTRSQTLLFLTLYTQAFNGPLQAFSPTEAYRLYISKQKKIYARVAEWFKPFNKRVITNRETIVREELFAMCSRLELLKHTLHYEYDSTQRELLEFEFDWKREVALLLLKEAERGCLRSEDLSGQKIGAGGTSYVPLITSQLNAVSANAEYQSAHLAFTKGLPDVPRRKLSIGAKIFWFGIVPPAAITAAVCGIYYRQELKVWLKGNG